MFWLYYTELPFRLIHRNGRVETHQSLTAAANVVTGHRPDVENWHTVIVPAFIRSEPGDFRIVNGYGDVIDGARVAAYRGRTEKKAKARPVGTHRNGPWPNIHSHFSSRGSFRRLVQTKACLTHQAAGRDDDLAPPVRSRIIPTAYDDIPRHRERSWKRHRRTQYK